MVYLAASVFSKAVILPTYNKIFTLENSDTAELRAWRGKPQTRNFWRAALQFTSVALMLIGLIGVV